MPGINMARIFLTGATGYIGGEFLQQVHAEHDITILLRNDAQRAIFEKYPVTIVVGDLNDAELIESETAKADVVFNLASTSNVVAATAIAKGLRSDGRWIQISGASMFSVPDITNGSYGDYREGVHDDSDQHCIAEVINTNPKRVVDQIVLKHGGILVVAPLIYGVGNGPGHQRSIQAPEMAKAFIQRGRGFKVGKGASVWSTIHVHDLGGLLTKLTHGGSGIFLPETGQMAFGTLAEKLIAETTKQGLTKSTEIDEHLTADQANEVMPMGAVFWATNAIMKSSRAQALLKWSPSSPTLLEEIPQLVKIEADLLDKE